MTKKPEQSGTQRKIQQKPQRRTKHGKRKKDRNKLEKFKSMIFSGQSGL
jgi:hypothetical protein